MIQNKEVLEQIREEAVKELNSYDCRILVCSGTGCVATGSQKIYEKFMEIAKDAPGVTIEFGPHDKDAHVGKQDVRVSVSLDHLFVSRKATM